MKEEKKQKKGKPGFSVLELMIAVFVLVIGIVGALGLISSTILNSMATRNATIASGLAQEGVELVRNIRDNNMLLALSDLSLDREDAFKTDMPNPGGNNDNCIVRVDGSPSPSFCSPGSLGDNSILYLSSTGFYNHHSDSLGAVETIFRRYVAFVYEKDDDNVVDPPGISGVNISSYVWWGGGTEKPATCNLATKCIVVEEFLPKRD